MINARAETLAEKPAFKSLFRTKRCIVPMDGFYEWKAGVEGGPVNAKGKLLKQPMYIHRADGDPLAVAGLWTRWKDLDDPEGRFLHSVTVITTAANHTMEPVHDRMPAILDPSQWAKWLDPANDDLDVLTPLLVGCDDDVLVMHEVSTDVNNVRRNGADLDLTRGVAGGDWWARRARSSSQGEVEGQEIAGHREGKSASIRSRSTSEQHVCVAASRSAAPNGPRTRGASASGATPEPPFDTGACSAPPATTSDIESSSIENRT